MRYYRVPRLGSGAVDDPFRPDVAASYVGRDVGDGTILVATPQELAGPGVQEIAVGAELEALCQAHALAYEDVRSWFAG